MAYSEGMFRKIATWVDAGVFPSIRARDRVVDLGSQMVNAGTSHASIADFIRRFNPSFDATELPRRFPVHDAYYCYVKQLWELAGLQYFSYDVTEAPGCRLFDLNFGEVPVEDR